MVICSDDYPKVLFIQQSRFPGESTKDYNNITLPFLKSLDEDMLCFPGHGDEGTLKEIFHDF
ncbi:hypothetical protein [Candidatus Symbiopectobacterium sp.]|uniref:hypothetical protein n=1 Tax=Candidatus Symbiopectobacterium sp. TaxID=2816440 RepID=UPI0025BC4949|nr:hypothetical protein [Candidatus Symbiopectobacterium sp.]